MPYDYAREIAEAEAEYWRHPEWWDEPKDYGDPPKRKPTGCSDRMCGAEDCPRCHPGTWMHAYDEEEDHDQND